MWAIRHWLCKLNRQHRERPSWPWGEVGHGAKLRLGWQKRRVPSWSKAQESKRGKCVTAYNCWFRFLVDTSLASLNQLEDSARITNSRPPRLFHYKQRSRTIEKPQNSESFDAHIFASYTRGWPCYLLGRYESRPCLFIYPRSFAWCLLLDGVCAHRNGGTCLGRLR